MTTEAKIKPDWQFGETEQTSGCRYTVVTIFGAKGGWFDITSEVYPTAEGKLKWAHCIVAAPDLLEALKGLLGDNSPVQGGICQHCGRDYIAEYVEGACESDDCPANIAFAAILKAEGRAQ